MTALEKMVLIIDDDEPVRKLLRFFIMKYFPHFQIEEASEGFEAGLKIQKFKPALILLDLKIPGQDGLALCKEIRAVPEFSKIVILIITGIQDALVHESALLFGANDYITKPFSAETLRDKINKHMIAGGGSHE